MIAGVSCCVAMSMPQVHIVAYCMDLGYGIGALSLGFVADIFGAFEAGFWFTAVAMALSGLWVALAMNETLPRPERSETTT